mmetsp:Transcript_18476/g.25609  ORF Transcript_18476/g.25609 Transcript_18476/m.25609 type:complete len:169 (+) Transcript_18476:43-549(+)
MILPTQHGIRMYSPYHINRCISPRFSDEKKKQHSGRLHQDTEKARSEYFSSRTTIHHPHPTDTSVLLRTALHIFSRTLAYYTPKLLNNMKAVSTILAASIISSATAFAPSSHNAAQVKVTSLEASFDPLNLSEPASESKNGNPSMAKFAATAAATFALHPLAALAGKF